MVELAVRLERAAHEVAGAPLAALERDAREFGADAPGRLGELGRALHAQWVAALTARAREADRAADRLAGAARAVRLAADRYAAADGAAHQRLTACPESRDAQRGWPAGGSGGWPAGGWPADGEP